MRITFRTSKLQRVIEADRQLQKEYGKNRARKIRARVEALVNASKLSDVPTGPPFRCHQLSGDRLGQFSVDVDRNLRLPFIVDHEPVPRRQDGGIDLDQVNAIAIVEVEDTHANRRKR